MYKVLVVDDDATCLTATRACFRRYNYYEVIVVSHALQVLSLLNESSEEEKSYDVILADVHMPVMDGFELLWHVNKNFNIPVILISADNKREAVGKGFSHGAQAYFLKPITTLEVKHLWQYSVLWKNREKYANKRFHEASVPRSISSYSSRTHNEEVLIKKKNNELYWNANLHNRFVEAILILGPTNSVPKKILDVMNVPSITREQVASHLQKFKNFLEKVLDGETSLHETSKYWIDCNYYSRIVRGNPNMILLNQLEETRRSGRTADAIRVSLPLPSLNETGTPSKHLTSVTFQSDENVCTSDNSTPMTQRSSHNFLSGVGRGMIGRTNNNMISSINHIVPYNGTNRVPNQLDCEHPFNVVPQGDTIPSTQNNFSNIIMQMENEQLNDLNIENSFGANQWGSPLGMDNEQKKRSRR